MLYYTYVLWSERLKKKYIGSTTDVKKRLSEHNRGKQRFTKGGIPWELLFHEQFGSIEESRRRELYLKSCSGRRYLAKKIECHRKGAGVDDRGGLENR